MGRLRVWLPLGVGVLVAAMILVFWLRDDDGGQAGGRRTIAVTATARLSGTHLPAAPRAVATVPQGMPADHCDPVWVDRAVLDVPVSRVRTVRGCDGTWLVVDVAAEVAECPSAAGVPNCTVTPRMSRWFMFFGARGWEGVTSTRAAGCAAVQSVQPAFPTSLCANLPAVG